MSTTNITDDGFYVESDPSDPNSPVAVCDDWLSPDEARSLVKAVNEALNAAGVGIDPVPSSLEGRVAALEAQAVRFKPLGGLAFEVIDLGPRIDNGRAGLDRLITDLFGPQPSVTSPEDAAPEPQPTNEEILATAVADQLEVSFDYKGEHDFKSATRYIEPSEVNTQSYRPYVLGFDVAANDTRKFLLERIQGEVIFS